MSVDHVAENIRLTSGEIAVLWTTYIANTASRCILKYYVEKANDQDMHQVLDFALSIAEKNIKNIESIYNTVNHPIPIGFRDSDVNINAERLFSDSFSLYYLNQLAQLGIANYAEALGVSARADVIKLFMEALQSSTELLVRVKDILIKKGLFIRPPYLDIPKDIEFVKKQSYLSGIIGDKRPINAEEITQLFINLKTNILGKAFALGLSQVAQNERVKKYVYRGKEIAEKHVDIFSEILKSEDLPFPTTWDSEVTNSVESPFSDKLILFMFTALNAYGLVLYGNALSKNFRTDIAATFARLSVEIAQYAKDGLDILIDNAWLEQLPQSVDKRELIGV